VPPPRADHAQAAGRRGEEELVGALYVLHGGGGGGRLRLLQGMPGRYQLAPKGDGGEVRAVRLRLRDFGPMVQGVPTVMAHQLGVLAGLKWRLPGVTPPGHLLARCLPRAHGAPTSSTHPVRTPERRRLRIFRLRPPGVRGLLATHPLLERLPAATLDKLSFAASPQAFSAGQRLTKQGAQAEALYLVLSGAVGLTMRLAAGHPRAPAGRVVQCGTCEAGGVVGHTSILAADAAATEKLEALTTTDTLALKLDKTSARALLPADVVAALGRRRDEGYLWDKESVIQVASELEPEKIVASGSFGTAAGRKCRLPCLRTAPRLPPW
jgi:hypothetical protein